MCEPATITALSVASTAVGTIAQSQSASDQGRALAHQLGVRNEEVSDQATVEIGRRARENRAQRARLRVAAGEAGVSGGSFEASIRNSLAQQARDEELIKLDARRGRRANAARYNAATSYIDAPRLALAGLQIAGDVNNYRRETRRASLNSSAISYVDPMRDPGPPRVA